MDGVLASMRLGVRQLCNWGDPDPLRDEVGRFNENFRSETKALDDDFIRGCNRMMLRRIKEWAESGDSQLMRRVTKYLDNVHRLGDGYSRFREMYSFVKAEILHDAAGSSPLQLDQYWVNEPGAGLQADDYQVSQDLLTQWESDLTEVKSRYDMLRTNTMEKFEGLGRTLVKQLDFQSGSFKQYLDLLYKHKLRDFFRAIADNVPSIFEKAERPPPPLTRAWFKFQSDFKDACEILQSHDLAISFEGRKLNLNISSADGSEIGSGGATRKTMGVFVTDTIASIIASTYL